MALLPTTSCNTVCRKWQQRWPAVYRATLVFILASGLGISFGAVVERVTAGVTSDASVAEAREVQVMQSIPQTGLYRYEGRRAPMGPSIADVFDGWYNDPTGATPPWTTGASTSHVVDRWYDESPAPTSNTGGHD
jgi:hypothetical protein